MPLAVSATSKEEHALRSKIHIRLGGRRTVRAVAADSWLARSNLHFCAKKNDLLLPLHKPSTHNISKLELELWRRKSRLRQPPTLYTRSASKKLSSVSDLCGCCCPTKKRPPHPRRHQRRRRTAAAFYRRHRIHRRVTLFFAKMLSTSSQSTDM